MAFQLLSVSFEDTSLGMNGTRTEDGQVLSVLFDSLTSESQADDTDAAPQVRRAEGLVRCEGGGWVSVQVRGTTAVVGGKGRSELTSFGGAVSFLGFLLILLLRCSPFAMAVSRLGFEIGLRG